MEIKKFFHGLQFYFHEGKHTMCRSIGDVRRHIFHGFENLKVEVQQETNAVIESIVSCSYCITSFLIMIAK